MLIPSPQAQILPHTGPWNGTCLRPLPRSAGWCRPPESACLRARTPADTSRHTRGPAPRRWGLLASGLLQVHKRTPLLQARTDRGVEGSHGQIEGERVFAADVDQADLYELVVMRKAAELLPLQRAIERERFGVSTS